VILTRHVACGGGLASPPVSYTRSFVDLINRVKPAMGKNDKKNKKKGKDGYRSQALSQGVGSANNNPFPVRGGGKKKKGGNGGSNGAAKDEDCLDAFCPTHLSLPRAVAPYLVVRVTTLVKNSSCFQLFGPMVTQQGVATGGNRSRNWCNQVGVRWENLADTQVGAVRRTCLPGNVSGFNGASIVPAAFTVQVMNPNPLQTTSGIVAMGRLKLATTFAGPLPVTQPALTAEELGGNAVAYYSPRLLAAAKLAMRGIQTSAIPVDMNDLSEFTPVDQRFRTDQVYNNESQAPSAGADAIVPEFVGFAPIFIYNPSQIELNFLVSTEYRCRFDPTNPASAGAVMHHPASTQTWDKVITGMVARGNGVVDIAERVASYGGAFKQIIQRGATVAGLLM